MGLHESKWYTVYEANGDKLVVIGYARECAAFMGMALPTFRSFVFRVKNGVIKTHAIAVEDLEEGSYEVYGSHNTGLITRGPTIDYERLEQFYNMGMADVDISREMGISAERIWNWRKKNGLPALGKRGRKKKGRAHDVKDFDLMKEAG